MFYLVRIKELIRLEPMELGRNLRQCIKQKIEKTYVGSCQPQYGYIILLITSHENDERLKIEDGVIKHGDTFDILVQGVSKKTLK